jgi:hypothetical protein
VPPILRLATLMTCAALSACAGRAPNPVAVVQPQDRLSDCTAVMAEINNNTRQIGALGSEDGGKVAQNIAAGVAGLFIPVLWLAMDFQNAPGKEGVALSQRNAYLAQLAEARCNGTVTTSLPRGTVTASGVATSTASAATIEVAPQTVAPQAVLERGPPPTR